MLAFPSFSDMFEMKRPQFMGRYFDDDEEEWFRPMGQQQGVQQNKQRRVPVQVHHEPATQHYQQHQMPQASAVYPQSHQYMPAPDLQQPQHTGVYPNSRQSMPAQQSNEAQPTNSQVRNPIQIPVQHMSNIDHWTPEGEIAPPLYSQKERSVPVVVQRVSPGREITIKSQNKEKDSEMGGSKVLQEPSDSVTQSNPPSIRKQTSLIVSDDHTTPIPLPYEPMVVEEALEEEDGREPTEAVIKPKYPLVRKQTSLMVSDDHTTPIPLPYEQLVHEDPIDEDVADGGQDESVHRESTITIPVQEAVKKAEEALIDEHDGSFFTKACPDEDVIEVALSPKQDIDEQKMPAFTKQKVIPIKVATSSDYNVSQEPSYEARNIPISVQATTKSPAKQTRQDTMPTGGETIISQPTMMPQMPQPQPTGGRSYETSQPHNTFTKPGDSYTQQKPPGPKPKEQWVDPRVKSAIDTIQKISDEAYSLGSQVDVLQVQTKDRNYLLIEEQLTKLLLKLDSIDSLGNDEVRSQRKACIKKVQQTLDALELKLLGS